MPHVRQQIREAVATAVTGLMTTGARVFQSRAAPLGEQHFPCLLVATGEEQAEIAAMGYPRRVLRQLEVAIDAHVKAPSDDIDDTLDSIISEVETALGSDPQLSDLLRDLRLSTIETEFAGDGAQMAGRAVMTWVADYHILENDPTTTV